MNVLPALFAAGGILALGWSTLRLLGWPSRSPAETFALSVAVGLAATMMMLYLPVALTGHVLFLPVVLAHALGMLVVARPALVTVLRRRVAVGSMAVIALVSALFYVDVVSERPFYSYDAKAIYGLKAKALLHERSLDAPLFQDTNVVHYHPDYPLGLPLLMAYTGYLAEGPPSDPNGLIAAGSAQEWVERYDAIHAYMPMTLLWVAGFLCLVVGWSRRSGLSRAATWCALVTPLALIAPWDIGASWRATPELPLALCLGAVALILCHVAGSDEGRPLMLAAAAAAGAVMLKNDFLIGLTALTVAGLVIGCRQRRKAILLAIGGGAAAGLVPVLLARAATTGAPFDEHYLGAVLDGSVPTGLARLGALPAATWEALLAAEALPFWAFLVLVAIPLAFRGSHVARMLAVGVALHMVLCLVVFLVTPNHIHWHIRTALIRLWSQMAGPACFLVVAALVTLWSERAPSREPARFDRGA